MRFSVVNLGCKVNQVELEKISDDLLALGYQFTKDSCDADFAIVNTCTVTQKADAKSFKIIKKLEADEHLENVFITGCFTELECGLLEKLQKKVVIVSQREKNNMAQVIENHLQNAFGYTNHDADYQNKWQAFKDSRIFIGSMTNQQSRFLQHTRAFVKVQDGCNAFCSYCRIPFARGGPVSRPIDDLLKQVSLLDQRGIPEIVLTGINMSIYRHKNKDGSYIGFSQMLRMVLDCCGSSFVRLSSIEPHYLDDDFLQCLLHPRFVPHLHLPVQATNDRILREMKRLYTLDEYSDLVKNIYALNPLFSISSDVITGYPDETDFEFQKGVEFLQHCQFSFLHVFPFSFRPLTSDNEKKQHFKNYINDFTRSWRAAHLRRVGLALQKKYAQSLLGKKMRLVVEEDPVPSENKKNFTANGVSEYYLRGKVSFLHPRLHQKAKKGQNLEVFLTKIADDGKNTFCLA